MFGRQIFSSAKKGGSRCTVSASILALGLVVLGSAPATALSVREATATLGLGYFGWTQGRIPVFDADGDGRPDLLLNAHNQRRWWLMLGRPDGGFRKSDAIPFHKYDLHGCTAADFAGPYGGPDNKVDLFCTVGADQGTSNRSFNKQLFVRGANGSFKDMGVARGLAMPLDRGRDALAANIDGNTVPDLVTAALASPSKGSFNRAFVNRGGFFTELPPARFPVRGVGGSECMAVLPKSSRFDDVLYCVKGNPGIAHFKNNGGTFSKLASAAYLRLAARKIEFADMNGDLKPDLIVLTGSELLIWLNAGGDTFPTKSASFPLAQGWAVAACRIDEDDDLDLFVAQGKTPSEKGAQRPDFVLLNAGNGRRFARFAVPRTNETGNADWVTCLPNWQGTGFAMVYVTNGRWLLSGHNRAYIFRR